MQQKDPLPKVSFRRHIVVGVFGGAQPAGSSVTLGPIRETNEDVAIYYRITHQAVAVSTTSAPAPAHPWLFSMMPRTDKKIRLTQKEENP
jgi:hypothetical protein